MVKAAGAKADNLPPSCAVVTKSGSLNLLESSGPVQACNGTALPYIQSVPLPTKPGSSLIIPKPMRILQRDLNRSTFVV